MTNKNNKPASPFRSIIEHFMSVHGVNEKGKKVLINFIWEQRDFFKAFKRKGGDVVVIFEVLSCIWAEEYEWSDYRLEDISPEEDFFSIKKFNKNRFITVREDKIPQAVWKVIKKMDQKLSMTKNPFAGKGRFTATYDLELPYKDERYRLTYTQTSFPDDPSANPCLKGRRAEWMSNLSMFIIYRYLNRLGFKGVYQAIADLTNGFSFHLFRGGGRLSPENVRKRIQWYKKKKHEVLANKAVELEKEILTEDGLRWNEAATLQTSDIEP